MTIDRNAVMDAETGLMELVTFGIMDKGTLCVACLNVALRILTANADMNDDEVVETVKKALNEERKLQKEILERRKNK